MNSTLGYIRLQKRVWVRLSALFLLIINIAAWGRASSSAVIQSIQVRGQRKIEAAAIQQKINSAVGRAVDPELVRADIRNIFQLGYFENIEVQEEAMEGGVRLIFQVQEKPIVTSVEYVGLDAIEKEDAKDTTGIKEYEVLDVHKLNTAVEKLIAKYEEKGFYLADVRYEITRDSQKGEAKVVFQIQENDKVQVKSINIIGNKVIPDEEIKGIMQTQEGGPFSWLTSSGAYREAAFERDTQAMGFYYGMKGYVRAKFGKPEVTVSADKKWIYITFFVEEGEQYSIGKIDFSGDLLYKKEELLEDVKLIEGEVFNTDLLRRETLRYTEKYSDLGYAFANVVPQPGIHDDTRTVDVNFEVERGDRVYIGEITVTGNTRTKDKVVRRELLIQEGELFNGTKKRESRENVIRLGFFDSVEFHQSSSRTAPNVVDIEVRVKERSTGQLVVGAGYTTGSSGGFIFNAQLSQNNFLGNGQVASLSAQLQTGDASRSEYNLGFQEPYVGNSRWSLGGSLYQTRRDVRYTSIAPTYNELKTGADIKLGHPVYEFTNLYLSYRFENSYVNNILDRAIFPPDLMNGYTSSVTANLVYDKRDDRFDPRDGFYWSASSELAGLGGDRKFVRSTANMKFFHPVVWDLVFRMNLTGANISALSDTVIPPNELFILGGLYSLRGYDFMMVGPRRTIATTSPPLANTEAAQKLAGTQIVIGGHNQIIFNAELEFPILKEARLRGVIFFDAGNAFDDMRGLSPVLLASVGYGLRWFTPIGPLRFEWGYPILGGEPRFFFTIGPAF